METCEVCERTGSAAKRCAFGHVKGPCSCWRGVPCGKAAKPLVLWGFKPGHGGVIRIEKGTKAAQARRTREGWTCAIYAEGDDPTALRAMLARDTQAEEDEAGQRELDELDGRTMYDDPASRASPRSLVDEGGAK